MNIDGRRSVVYHRGIYYADIVAKIKILLLLLSSLSYYRVSLISRLNMHTTRT